MKPRIVIVTTTLILSLSMLILLLPASGGNRENQQHSRLITPTLWAEYPNQFACNLSNVSDRIQSVRIRIISNGSILLDTDDLGGVTVEPLHTANYWIEAPHGPENPRGAPIYCEFTVEGPKLWYRGAAKVFPPEDSGNLTDLTAIPAE